MKNGKLTPSGFAKLMTGGRSKEEKFGKVAIEYMHSVMLERIGVYQPEVWAKALEWGNENESLAIAAYEERKGIFVKPTITIQHPKFDFVAGTPDGLVDKAGIIEVKCPYNPVNHMLNITDLLQIKEYKYQIQGYLWITDREWCDFVSYDPRFPDGKDLFIHRVYRDQEMISLIQERCIEAEQIILRLINVFNIN